MEKKEKEELYSEVARIVRAEVEEAFMQTTANFAEGFNERFSLMVEGFIAMDGRMDAMQIVLNSHTEMLSILMMDVEVIKQAFSYINSTIDSP